MVADLGDQESVLDALLATFADPKVDDRRVEPMYGYRAVHVIVRALEAGRVVEIQVRTELQDLWAQVSEKLADELGLDVKYGGGPPEIRNLLDRLSRLARALDEERADLRERRSRVVLMQNALAAVQAAGGGDKLAEARANMVEVAQAVEERRQLAGQLLIDFREIVGDLLAY